MKQKIFSLPNLLWGILILATACSTWKFKKSTSSHFQERSWKAVTNRLAIFEKSKDVYIDSILQERSTIFNRNEFQNAAKAFPDLFYADKISPTSFSYIIPDSLSTFVKYKGTDTDLEYGPNTYLFFSPLLKTKQKRIYALQVYKLETIYDHEVTIRLAERYYDLFEISGKSLRFMETISSEEDVFSLPFSTFHKD